jgi:subtilisin family serine protease
MSQDWLVLSRIREDSMRAKRLFFALLFVLLFTVTTWAETPNLIIVQTMPGAEIGPIAATLGGTVVDSMPGGSYLVSVTNLPTSLPAGASYIESDSGATLLGFLGTVAQIPAATSPDFYNMQPIGKLIQYPLARTQSTGKGVIVADIDSLVDYSHPALKGHLTGGYDFVIGRGAGAASLNQSSASFLDQSSASFLDQSSASFLDQSSASFLDQSSASFLDAANPAHGHGTLVAGIIAAWAPDSMIMPLRAFDNNGEADTFIIAKAVRYAVDNGAHVINMSFGLDTLSMTLRKSLDYAAAKNVVLVASAGNSNSSTPQYPAAYSNVMSVAATDLADTKAWFSNYSSTVFVSAPGVNVIAPYPGGYYAVVNGTSFAAPIVAAQAALIRVREDAAHNVRDKVRGGTVDIDARNPGYKDLLGNGRVDLYRSVK